MRRPLLLALSCALLGACAAVLDLHALRAASTFEVSYRGTIAPEIALPPFEDHQAAAPAAAGPAVTLRATVLELDEGTMRRWLPAPGTDGKAPQGLSGLLCGREDLALAVRSLSGQADILCAPQVVTMMGQRAVIQTGERMSYVRAADLRMSAGGVVADPVVAEFEHGLQLGFAPRMSSLGMQLGISWRTRTPLQPTPLAQGLPMAIQLPTLQEQHVEAEVTLSAGLACVLGPLAAAAPGRFQILCVEADLAEQPAVVQAASAQADAADGRR